MINSPTLAPLRQGSLFRPIPLHYPRALAKGDLCPRPSSYGCPIRRDRRLEVIDAGDMLHDVIAGRVPDIDPESEGGLGVHGRPAAAPKKAAGAGKPTPGRSGRFF